MAQSFLVADLSEEEKQDRRKHKASLNLHKHQKQVSRVPHFVDSSDQEIPQSKQKPVTLSQKIAELQHYDSMKNEYRRTIQPGMMYEPMSQRNQKVETLFQSEDQIDQNQIIANSQLLERGPPRPLVEYDVEQTIPPLLETVDSRPVPFDSIEVVDVKWIGNMFSGHRQFYVVSKQAGKEIASVYRRYRSFRWLVESLERSNPGCVIPPLPAKDSLLWIQDDMAEGVISRRKGLSRFLQRILNHKILRFADDFIGFATDSVDIFEARQNRESMDVLSGNIQGGGGKGIVHNLRNLFTKTYVTNNIRATLPTWITDKVLSASDEEARLEVIGGRVGDFKEKDNQIGHLLSQVQHKHTQLVSVAAALEKLQASLNKEGERGEEFSEAMKACVRTQIGSQHLSTASSGLFSSFAEVHSQLAKEANLRNFKWAEEVTQPLQDCVAYLERMQEVVARYEQYKLKMSEELDLLKKREVEHHGINQESFAALDQQRTVVSELEKIFIALREELILDGKEVYESVVRQTQRIKWTVAEIEEEYTQRVATLWRDFMSKNPSIET